MSMKSNIKKTGKLSNDFKNATLEGLKKQKSSWLTFIFNICVVVASKLCHDCERKTK